MRTLLIAVLLLAGSPSIITQEKETATYVWICTGKSAYSYHNNRGCRGLNRCRASIKKVTIEKARSMKRTPCDICY